MLPDARKPPILPANAVDETIIVSVTAKRTGLSIFILILIVNGSVYGWLVLQESRSLRLFLAASLKVVNCNVICLKSRCVPKRLPQTSSLQITVENDLSGS
jgi:hypothetical protein